MPKRFQKNAKLMKSGIEKKCQLATLEPARWERRPRFLKFRLDCHAAPMTMMMMMQDRSEITKEKKKIFKKIIKPKSQKDLNVGNQEKKK